MVRRLIDVLSQHLLRDVGELPLAGGEEILPDTAPDIVPMVVRDLLLVVLPDLLLALVDHSLKCLSELYSNAVLSYSSRDKPISSAFRRE